MCLRCSFFLLVYFSCTFCFAQEQWGNGYPPDATIDHYTAEEYDIRFPATWTLDTSGLLHTEFIVTSPKEEEQDVFRENVSLVIKESKNLHDHVVASETLIRNNGIIIESRRRINDSRQEYHMMLYTLHERPDLIYEQYYFFKYWYLYELTCVYEHATFHRNRPDGEVILNSFGFKFPWSY